MKHSKPVKDKRWSESYKMESEFLRANFSEVLPGIIDNVVKKRPTDPVHYIVYFLIKYQVDKSMNVKKNKRLF